ncbi:MAG TPA: hypothetical protein VIX83_07540 [Candidatus Cybelea sp.]
MRIRYALAAAALLAGCAQPGGNAAFAPDTTNATRSTSALRAAAGNPPHCPQQRSRKRYAQTVSKLKRSGGSVCVAEFRGFGGALQYPAVERSIQLTDRTTVGNIYYQPEMGSGKPLLYLNLHFSENTRFGSSVASAGGLSSSKFVSGQAYTAFGQVAVGHLVFMFTPCYSVATSGAYGGLLPNIGALFDNAIITGNGFGVIEIYPGAQVSQECEGTSG